MRWMGSISAVLDSGHTAELGLLLHDYRGALDEAFELRRREHVGVDSLRVESLTTMQRDVLYLFRASA